MFDISAALPTFVITLREGVEAALVVGIVLACLGKANQADLNRWVYLGIGLGLMASAAVGVGLSGLLLRAGTLPYGDLLKALLKGSFSLIAIVLLSWMLVWMTAQSRSLKTEITAAVGATLAATGAGWGIAGLIFTAVLREGVESVLFILTQAQLGWVPIGGAIAGLLSAVLVGVMLFQWGIRLNLGLFFKAMGILLLLIVAGLVISALYNLDTAARILSQMTPQFAHLCSTPTGSCLLGPLVWDLHEPLPDRRFPGVLFKTLLGYRDRLYLGQAIGYLGFLLTLGTLYFRSLNQPVPANPAKPNPSA